MLWMFSKKAADKYEQVSFDEGEGALFIHRGWNFDAWLGVQGEAAQTQLEDRGEGMGNLIVCSCLEGGRGFLSAGVRGDGFLYRGSASKEGDRKRLSLR